MISKFFKVVLIVVLAFGLSSFKSSSSEAADTKVMWGNTELKLGQIGKVSILNNTVLYKLDKNNSLTKVRNLKKGEAFRVYSYKSMEGELYGVGGSSFIYKSPAVKFEATPKDKLEHLKESILWKKIKPNLNLNVGIQVPIHLKDGNVMLIGDKSSFIFDYKKNTWKKAAPINQKGDLQAPILLQDGRVLVFTGFDAYKPQFFKKAEIYNPKTDKWSMTGELKNHRNINVSPILLPNGNVMIAGATKEKTNFVEIYNPKTNKWSTAANMNYFTSTDINFLPMKDGKILAMGGVYDLGTNPSFMGTDKATAVEIYDYQKDKWTFYDYNQDLNVSEKLFYLSNDTIFFVGQFGTGIYNLDENKLNELTKYNFSPVDALEIQPGKVLMTGTSDQINSVGYTYTVETDELKKINIPSNSPYLFLLPNGKVLVLGTTKWEPWESDPQQYSGIFEWNTMYLFSPLAK